MDYYDGRKRLTDLWFKIYALPFYLKTYIWKHIQNVLIIHEVEDYPAWKAIFDSAVGIRKNAGEISYNY